MKDKRVLLVDDEAVLLKGLTYSLKMEQMEVVTAMDGKTALALALGENFDLIILDIMLPGISGLEILKRLRLERTTPVIMLTAKGDDESKVLGLEFGADDYLTKPFNMLELKARIKSVFRRMEFDERGSRPAENAFETGAFKFNAIGRKACFEGRDLALTSKEFDLLYLLATHPGEVFSRERLLEKVWGYDYFGDARTVDVHVRRVRKKIGEWTDKAHVMTEWGVGYYYKK